MGTFFTGVLISYIHDRSLDDLSSATTAQTTFISSLETTKRFTRAIPSTVFSFLFAERNGEREEAFITRLQPHDRLDATDATLRARVVFVFTTRREGGFPLAGFPHLHRSEHYCGELQE